MMDISCESADSIIHKDLKYHKIYARWVPKQLTDEHKHAYNFCSSITKERLSCNVLSQVMKRVCTTMNVQANTKAWSGNTSSITQDDEIQKCAFC
jgi:hypothetical protein